MVEFKTGTGKGTGYIGLPEKPRGGVLVLHAWWGLNDFFKSFCDRLASHGFLAFAPDLQGGKVAKTVSEAKELMPKIDEDSRRAIVLGALGYLRSQPSQSGRKTGVVGFSMGAFWALWLSTEAGRGRGGGRVLWNLPRVGLFQIKGIFSR